MAAAAAVAAVAVQVWVWAAVVAVTVWVNTGIVVGGASQHAGSPFQYTPHCSKCI